MLRTRWKEFKDLSLLKGGLPVVKTIEGRQLFGLLAPVNHSNVDRDNAKEMLKRQGALQKAAKKAATGKREESEDGTLEEILASRLWRLDCLKETLLISETDCDAMRAAGLTAALEVKLLVYSKSATCYSEKNPLHNCLPAFEAIADKAKGGSSQILNMRA